MPTVSPPVSAATPVLIGAGQAANPLSAPDYQSLSASDLAARAAIAAIEDTGVKADRVVGRIDTVGAVRQFQASVPGATSPFGTTDNFPRSVALRLGAEPTHAVVDVAGGQSPQHLLSEMAARIRAGLTGVVLLVGAEVLSTVAAAQAAGTALDFSENVGGDLEDRGFGLGGVLSLTQLKHQLLYGPEQYALAENARRARRGLGHSSYLREMAELFAPFSRVAAGNPYAASPQARSAVELSTVSQENRLIADPYPRLLVSRDTVNQAAAVLMTSVGAAQVMGISQDRLVYLAGHADLVEAPVFARPDLGSSPAAVAAVRGAVTLAGCRPEDIDAFDFYSCFPIAVSNVLDGLGLSRDDSRGFTLTGGLPYFGGPGNNYSMHAICEAVRGARGQPGARFLVGANGGILSKYSVGVYTAQPTAWQDAQSAEVQADLDSAPRVAEQRQPDGYARLETYTLKHHRDGTTTGVAVGRLERTGERVVAIADDDLLARLTDDSPFGLRFFARSSSVSNRGSLVRLTERRASPAPDTRPYDFLDVRRNGRVLEVTINRPRVRNALHPPAHAELDQVFTDFLIDQDLRVCILTGAGDQAFCAGNDLAYTASSGAPWEVPPSGFGGLTNRPDLAKPIIAAVNGFAFGGGLELVLACHLAVASRSATFALPEVKVGLVAGAGGLARLPRRLPVVLANELILTGRPLSADEAAAHGLVNRVVDPAECMVEARRLAEQLLAVSPTSVRLSLQGMALAARHADEQDAVDATAPVLDDLFVSADMAEGMRAFTDKRRPQWRNQ